MPKLEDGSQTDFEKLAFDAIADRIDDRPRTISQNFEEWVAENYLIDGARFSLSGYEPLKDIYADNSKEIVVMKSAQCGASEWLIAFSFYFPSFYGENVFYGMPAKDQIKDFVQGRIDPRIDDSPKLQALIKSTDNIDLKRVGMNFIYYRGSQNRKQITTVDAGLLILDEFDQMVQSHVPIMEKRLGDSDVAMKRKISTPSIPEFGIHREYLASDQHECHLQCKGCYEWVAPDWSRNISPTPTRDRSAPAPEIVKLVCHKCGAELDRHKTKWIAQNPGAAKRGYHISKLVMPRTNLLELWLEFRDTINLQDFYNGNLGLPFTIEGGQLTQADINACRRSAEEEKEFQAGAPHKNCTMGVDVGRLLHVRISKKPGELKQAVWIGAVKTFEDLRALMDRYDIRRCVVDALPETRKAVEFAEKYSGRVFLAYYDLSDPHKVFVFDHSARPAKVRINRSRAMDMTSQNFYDRRTRLPSDADVAHTEYCDHMKAPQKAKVVDKNGNEEYKYIENSKADHWFHAEVYDDIANQGPRLKAESL